MDKHKKQIIIFLILLVGFFICIYGPTYAKYVSNSVWDYYLKSKGFYLSSDQLGMTSIKNIDNLWNGEGVYFNIKNSLNENVITNYDINYRAICNVTGEASSYAECHMNGESTNTEDGVLSSFESCVNNTEDQVNVTSFNKTECELGGYEWLSQVAKKDLYFEVILTDTNYELKDVTVNVTVTSTNPYRKTISGEFILHKSTTVDDNVTMKYHNYSNYDRLIVSNSYQDTKCVRIAWDSNNLLIDASPSEFSSYEQDSSGYINEIKLNILAKDSLDYIFYKRNFSATYNVSEFTLETTSGC